MNLPKPIAWILMFLPIILISLGLIFLSNLQFTGMMIIPFLIVLYLFVIFWMVEQGSRWQKHQYLGLFARFIQKSQFRAFITFFSLTFLMVFGLLGVMMGFWVDSINIGTAIRNTSPVVNSLLLMFLLLSAMIPIMWSSFRRWRQAARSAAEVRVRVAQ
ncbi:MAG: hypothetical protein ACW974_04915 [Candidatus Thorarchaeota archaeon]